MSRKDTVPAEVLQQNTKNEEQVVQKGTPSEYLQKALQNAQTVNEGGILDTSGLDAEDREFFRTTVANAEKGIFNIIGGAIDKDGILHRQFQLRAMTGYEEDILGDRSSEPSVRMNSIMTRCVESIGSITDKQEIAEMVKGLSSGSRTDLLIAVRMVSHWHSEKDMYSMEIECPFCNQKGSYKVSLLDLERFEPENPAIREYKVELPVSKVKASWKVLGFEQDSVLSSLGKISEAEALTYAILMRLASFDGEICDLHPNIDFLDRNKKRMRLSVQAKKFYSIVKSLTVGDRDFLRSEFFENESSVETDVEVVCDYCHKEFETFIDVGQPGFFFPQVTLKRSKRKRSS
jgi:hypothetical protein